MSTDFIDHEYGVRGGAARLSGPYNGHRDRADGKFLAGVKAIMRLVIPVFALLAVFFALALYFDTALPFFPDAEGRFWLSDSHLILPAAFFVIHLTNRRFGSAYAFAQLTVSLSVVAAVVLFAKADLESLVRMEILPSMREVAAFGGAFFVSGFLSIAAFEGARGPAWWSAPLFGFLVAAIFFPLIYFPAAYAGLDMPWIANGLTYMGILIGEGILFLLPYMLARPVVVPQSGLGGY